MTDKDANVAVAEACGFTNIHIVNGMWVGVAPGSLSDSTFPLPDYDNDLNAMHEAEKTLKGEQPNEYQNQLIKVAVTFGKLFPTGRAYPIDGYVIHATATQRREAFLRTLGKWRD